MMHRTCLVSNTTPAACHTSPKIEMLVRTETSLLDDAGVVRREQLRTGQDHCLHHTPRQRVRGDEFRRASPSHRPRTCRDRWNAHPSSLRSCASLTLRKAGSGLSRSIQLLTLPTTWELHCGTSRCGNMIVSDIGCCTRLLHFESPQRRFPPDLREGKAHKGRRRPAPCSRQCAPALSSAGTPSATLAGPESATPPL